MDIAKTKTGDLISITYYVHVENIKTNELLVRDVKNGSKFVVRGKELIEDCRSASQFASTKKLTKTDLAEKLVSSPGIPMTVCFEKVDGTERVLSGYITSSEPLLGRSHAVDCDVTSGSPLRLVDHRTLKYVIMDGVKYELKK